MTLPTSRELREMLAYASPYPWKREYGFIRPARENASWSIAAIEDGGEQLGGDDDIDLMLIAPQLAEEVIRLRDEIESLRDACARTATVSQRSNDPDAPAVADSFQAMADCPQTAAGRGRRVTISKEKIADLAVRALAHQRRAQEATEHLWTLLPEKCRETVNPKYGEVWVVLVFDRITHIPVTVTMFVRRRDFWAPLAGDPWGDVLTTSLVVPLYKVKEADI